MSKRQKMSREHSKAEFSKHASTTHKKNIGHNPGSMRGGIRL
ncbi:MAG: hypothetical protein [Microvirus sp.]|nr:MAG: hypothetical protein [Microvirus sp.]